MGRGSQRCVNDLTFDLSLGHPCVNVERSHRQSAMSPSVLEELGLDMISELVTDELYFES